MAKRAGRRHAQLREMRPEGIISQRASASYFPAVRSGRSAGHHGVAPPFVAEGKRKSRSTLNRKFSVTQSELRAEMETKAE
jgi:hypothetical protein